MCIATGSRERRPDKRLQIKFEDAWMPFGFGVCVVSLGQYILAKVNKNNGKRAASRRLGEPLQNVGIILITLAWHFSQRLFMPSGGGSP